MAGLLDAFTIAFNSEGLRQFEQNLKNNEKELDKYQKKVDELQGALDDLAKKNLKDSDTYKSIEAELETARGEVDRFQKSVDTMKGRSEYQLLSLKKNFGNLMKTVGLLAGVGIAVRKSLQFYEQAEQLDFLAQKTGIAVEKLQELGNAASKYGGTTEGTATSVENIRTNKEEYKKAGITIGEDPTQTLENVARKMETLKSDTAKWDLANSLGIDEGTTRLLIQGVERYREELKRTSKYKLYTKEDIERMRDFRQVQQDIRMGLQSIFGALSRLLLPVLTVLAKVIRSVTDWFAEHEGAVQIVAVFIGIAAAIGGIIGVIHLLNAALGLLLTNPVVLTIVGIAAALTALYVLIDDFVVFLQGGDSLIGEILENMGYDTELLRKDIINILKNIQQWITSTIDSLAKLGQQFSVLSEKIKSFWEAIPKPLRALLTAPMRALPPFVLLNLAKKTLEPYKKAEANSVPAGAISNYNSVQAINENNNKNVNNTNTSNNKETYINSINILAQHMTSQDLVHSLYNISDFDNGMILP